MRAHRESKTGRSPLSIVSIRSCGCDTKKTNAKFVIRRGWHFGKRAVAKPGSDFRMIQHDYGVGSSIIPCLAKSVAASCSRDC
jgi:hypothetical protein